MPAGEDVGHPDQASAPGARRSAPVVASHADRAGVRSRAVRAAVLATSHPTAGGEQELTSPPLDVPHRAEPQRREPAAPSIRPPALGELAQGPGRLPSFVAVSGSGRGLGLAELLAALALAGARRGADRDEGRP